ncbi:glycosyltransferase [Pseudodesulfovibrio sp.]|uniref:glycosyltransferase n=1 Tax=unclassified Pseudodesulfovibrio TaxID=2661612 RepID=UPI003AFFC470
MITSKYFDMFQRGMTAQIQDLSLPDFLDYARNHLQSFLMCEAISLCFLERLANDGETARNKGASNALLYFLDKALQKRPLRPGLLEAAVRLTGDKRLEARAKVIDKLNTAKETYDLISGLDFRTDGEDARTFIAQLIQTTPENMAAAQLALSLDRIAGQAPAWINDFHCNIALKQVWETALFNHYAELSFYDKAMELWGKLKQDRLREHSLNVAAEMFIAQGDLDKGLELYEASVQMDPRQTPVKLRMRELRSPFLPNHELIGQIPVNICLYSWNKAEMLGQTLESLSRSDIGNARIDVLLNGCTDDSLAEVEKARALFPDNEFTIHQLHVNIGAPAARNWLMFLPEVQKAKYIAFLDDDVTIQKDWLAHFLTIAESDDNIGVVGCKTVHPGTPSLSQYLFRYIAIAQRGVLKMSINAPNRHFDNHCYDFVRECRNVMGCQHLLRTKAINDIPAGFDIRFSPSQVDDIDHDVCLALKGWKVMYTGLVTCIHHQSSGTNVLTSEFDPGKIGSIMGNDIKFFFKHATQLEKLAELDCLSLDLGFEQPPF